MDTNVKVRKLKDCTYSIKCSRDNCKYADTATTYSEAEDKEIAHFQQHEA